MRDSVKLFVKCISEIVSFPEPIYEFGSLQVEGQEDYADLRPLLSGKKYFGCDVRKGKGVDLILNLHNIDVADESVGTVLIMDTLEHVELCRRAMSEVFRILKPGGVVLISSVMNFPIHEYPRDYWRFTPEGFKSLLKEFSWSFVDFLGDKNFPHTVVGIGMKDKDICVESETMIKNKMEKWKGLAEEERDNEGRVKQFIKQFMPPILIELYRKVRY